MDGWMDGWMDMIIRSRAHGLRIRSLYYLH